VFCSASRLTSGSPRARRGRPKIESIADLD
jgi:hypothetical protein